MYAIFEDGSRQYRVSEGDVVRVDFRRVSEEERVGVADGTSVEFTRVLLFSDGNDVRIGQPVVEGMRVIGEVVDHPSIKTRIMKYRRRKNYRRRQGHRQFYTAVKVRHILLPGQDIPARQEAAPVQTPAPVEAPAPTEPTPASN